MEKDHRLEMGGDPILGGDVKDHDEDAPVEHVQVSPTPEVKVEDHDSKNRALLAQWLIGILAGLIAVHYLLIFILEWNGKKDVKTLETAFNSSLPVISGLVASAVTYYFTRGERR